MSTPGNSLYSRYILVENLLSYDPYDIWNTGFGRKIKKAYYSNRVIGIIPSALFLIFDSYLNTKTRKFFKKREYPMVHAYRVLVAMDLYKNVADPELLKAAKKSLSWLSVNYSKGYNGYCWGANMPWVSKNGFYKESTPFITNTPYVLEALIDYQMTSGDDSFDQIVPTIYDFIEKDLQKLIDSEDQLALSYSPQRETRIVINANSYALFCYCIFYSRHPEKRDYIKGKIERLYRFIKGQQQQDGSWFYYADNLQGNFIDCFHSCFILKNLIKANTMCELPSSSEVIKSGYRFLKENFFDEKRSLFKRFSKSDKFSLVQFDLYDNAEMLNLGTLLGDVELVETLHRSIKRNFFNGQDIYSQIIFPDIRIHKNTLRWAVMPLLHSLVKSNFIDR